MSNNDQRTSNKKKSSGVHLSFKYPDGINEIEREIKVGKLDFEILIDGFRAVSRTNKINQFRAFEDQLTKLNRQMVVRTYANSNPNNKMYNSYTFHIASDYTPESHSNHEGLGSLGEITQKLRSEIMQEIEFDRAKKLAAKYRKERDELQERVDELEAELKKIPLANLLGVQGGAALSAYLKSNPAIVARMPSGLAGLLGVEEDEKPEQIEGPQETKATFKPKQAAAEQPKEHDFIVFIKSSFDVLEQNKIIKIVQHFAKDKNALQTVFDLLI